MDIDKVRELVKLFKEEELTKLKIEEENTKIHIEKISGKQTADPAESGTENNSTSPARSSNDGLTDIKAAQVGTFFLQKEEDSDETFVNTGDRVQKGDQIGIIEAMKVFNDVTSGHSGVIEEILVENGETVEYDQVLMRLRKEDE